MKHSHLYSIFHDHVALVVVAAVAITMLLLWWTPSAGAQMVI